MPAQPPPAPLPPPAAHLLYIDIEHPSQLATADEQAAHHAQRLHEKLLFEQLSGLPCLWLRYHDLFSPHLLAALHPAAVLISGLRSEFSTFDPAALAALLAFIRGWQGPLIGFCGGHQLIAQAHGAAIGPIRPLAPDESDPRPTFGPGFVKEIGFCTVMAGPDALFTGLPPALAVYQEHYWQVQNPPAGWQTVAASPLCPVQAMARAGRCQYGLQFHPERSDPAHPHGYHILRNFFTLALPRPTT